MTLSILALFIQHAKHFRRIVLSSVAGLAVPYFSTLPYKQQEFQKNVYGIKICFFSYNFCLKHFSF
jgi:hypothetical protein